MPRHLAFINTLSAERKALAEDRAILVAQVIIPARPAEHAFTWLKPPPMHVPEDATWYIDGSMVGGRHNATRRLGYAIVLVSKCGSLLAFGNGRPPSWITDSAGAECWAYFCVIGMSIFVPHVVTDCLGILSMLTLGKTAATLATRPLARVWVLFSIP